MEVYVSHPTSRHNFTIVHLGSLGLAFSYQTLVGISRVGRYGWTVIENQWGPTTGKHLNYLDNGRKDERLTAEEFAKLEAEVLGAFGVHSEGRV